MWPEKISGWPLSRRISLWLVSVEAASRRFLYISRPKDKAAGTPLLLFAGSESPRRSEFAQYAQARRLCYEFSLPRDMIDQ
jgi:hypothetical protein